MGCTSHVDLRVLTRILFNSEEREHGIFEDLLRLSPGLDKRVMRASEQELHYIADMVSLSFSLLSSYSPLCDLSRSTRERRVHAQTIRKA